MCGLPSPHLSAEPMDLPRNCNPGSMLALSGTDAPIPLIKSGPPLPLGSQDGSSVFLGLRNNWLYSPNLWEENEMTWRSQFARAGAKCRAKYLGSGLIMPFSFSPSPPFLLSILFQHCLPRSPLPCQELKCFVWKQVGLTNMAGLPPQLSFACSDVSGVSFNMEIGVQRQLILLCPFLLYWKSHGNQSHNDLGNEIFNAQCY